ncbi:MAG: hypothetical protein ACT4PT_14040, partial [Methanobacteriota archaeon]
MSVAVEDNWDSGAAFDASNFSLVDGSKTCATLVTPCETRQFSAAEFRVLQLRIQPGAGRTGSADVLVTIETSTDVGDSTAQTFRLRLNAATTLTQGAISFPKAGITDPAVFVPNGSYFVHRIEVTNTVAESAVPVTVVRTADAPGVGTVDDIVYFDGSSSRSSASATVAGGATHVFLLNTTFQHQLFANETATMTVTVTAGSEPSFAPYTIVQRVAPVRGAIYEAVDPVLWISPPSWFRDPATTISNFTQVSTRTVAIPADPAGNSTAGVTNWRVRICNAGNVLDEFRVKSVETNRTAFEGAAFAVSLVRENTTRLPIETPGAHRFSGTVRAQANGQINPATDSDCRAFLLNARFTRAIPKNEPVTVYLNLTSQRDTEARVVTTLKIDAVLTPVLPRIDDLRVRVGGHQNFSLGWRVGSQPAPPPNVQGNRTVNITANISDTGLDANASVHKWVNITGPRRCPTLLTPDCLIVNGSRAFTSASGVRHVGNMFSSLNQEPANSVFFWNSSENDSAQVLFRGSEDPATNLDSNLVLTNLERPGTYEVVVFARNAAGVVTSNTTYFRLADPNITTFAAPPRIQPDNQLSAANFDAGKSQRIRVQADVRGIWSSPNTPLLVARDPRFSIPNGSDFVHPRGLFAASAARDCSTSNATLCLVPMTKLGADASGNGTWEGDMPLPYAGRWEFAVYANMTGPIHAFNETPHQTMILDEV